MCQTVRARRVTAFATCAALALTGSFAAAQTSDAGKRVALLVGVNKYDKRNFRDLKYAERDVEELAKVLESARYDVHLLTGSAQGDKRATLEHVEKAVEAVLKGRSTKDLVLVALAGHGLQLEVTGGDGKLRAESFYCPVDAEQGNFKTMLAMGKLFEEIDRRGGGHNLVLVDACREDPTRGRGLDGSKVQALPEGLAVLFGCRSGQKTFETKNAGGGHGLLFHFVLEGLRGGAKNEEGDVTWDRLTEYVRNHVSRDASRLVGDSIEQTPNLVANLPGECPVLVKRTFADSLGIKLVAIQPGEFWMGTSAEELSQMLKEIPAFKRDDFVREQPRHQVRITKRFALGAHEVTVGQFRKFVQDTRHKTDAERDGRGGHVYQVEKGTWEYDPTTNWRSPGFKQNENHPVVQVSWNDAVAFCKWLSAKDGRTFRLPTEAEWEYSCRAGTVTRYYNGDDTEGLAEVGNVGDAMAKAKLNLNNTISASDGYVFTAPVGSYKPNAWGLYDMHGNVWEWCQDYYVADYYKNARQDDPQGPPPTANRVKRGGGWYPYGWGCRSAARLGSPQDFRGGSVGFRVLAESP